VPCVIIGTSNPKTALSCVDIDNVAESRSLAEFLISQGHRRIAFVGGPDFVLSARQRAEGFRAALRAHGLALPKAFLLGNVIFPGEVQTRVHKWMRLPEARRPTAILCWDDGAACEVIDALLELNIKVPGDVSLVGINDSPAAALSRPPLTTLRQPYDEIGKCAVDELLRQIQNPSPPTEKLLKGELIIRESVAAPHK
jgi:LacI family transcriptional regulator